MRQPRAALAFFCKRGELGKVMLKKLLAQPWFQEVIAFLALVYIETVRRSIRWEVRNDEFIKQCWEDETPIVGAIWHGRVLMALQAWYKHYDRMHFLASRSREGDIGNRLVRWYRVHLVRGSSRNTLKPEKNKGGEQAYREMVSLIQAGQSGAMTPDGPRGPRYRAGFGAVRMARDTGAPLIPVTWSTRRKWIVRKAWDRHCIPQFFTRGVIIWGDPIHVAADAGPEELEAARLLLETRLNEMTREADEAMGCEPIEPSDRLRPGTAGEPPEVRDRGAAS